MPKITLDYVEGFITKDCRALHFICPYCQSKASAVFIFEDSQSYCEYISIECHETKKRIWSE